MNIWPRIDTINEFHKKINRILKLQMSLSSTKAKEMLARCSPSQFPNLPMRSSKAKAPPFEPGFCNACVLGRLRTASVFSKTKTNISKTIQQALEPQSKPGLLTHLLFTSYFPQLTTYVSHLTFHTLTLTFTCPRKFLGFAAWCFSARCCSGCIHPREC